MKCQHNYKLWENECGLAFEGDTYSTYSTFYCTKCLEKKEIYGESKLRGKGPVGKAIQMGYSGN